MKERCFSFVVTLSPYNDGLIRIANDKLIACQ